MEHYCFDIIFPEKLIDFVSPKENDKSHKFHAHLYTKESSIELRIFFGFNFITPEFSSWLDNGSLEKAFAECVVKNINKENCTQKIDLSKSKIIGYSFGGNQNENGLGEYFKITLSSVRIYIDSSINKLNSADFYMNEVGFDLVKDFHSLLFGNNGEFKISRMKGREVFYKFGNFEFRPEFDFNYSDDRNETKAIIEKKPKIKFTFSKESSEKEILRCAEIVRLLGSFYMHNNIEYNFSRIHLQNSTLLIYKSKVKDYRQTDLGLQGFGLKWDFHDLLQSNWQLPALKNFKIISKVIPLFNQAMLVDHHSSLLIRYNILEISKGNKDSEKKEFDFLLTGNAKKKNNNEALSILLQSVKSEDHSEFKKRWNDVSGFLNSKPMMSPLNKFIQNHGIPIKEMPLNFKEIKEIRDYITHGSLDKVNKQQLEKANILLYGITGVLILKLFGVNEFDLKRIYEKIETIQ